MIEQRPRPGPLVVWDSLDRCTRCGLERIQIARVQSLTEQHRAEPYGTHPGCGHVVIYRTWAKETRGHHDPSPRPQ